MQIFFRTRSGNTITLDLESADTIDSIKCKLQEKEGIPFFHLVLIFCGKLATDAAIPLIQKEGCMHLVVRNTANCKARRVRCERCKSEAFIEKEGCFKCSGKEGEEFFPSPKKCDCCSDNNGSASF
jgi:large subunit ribosomal protein L40e